MCPERKLPLPGVWRGDIQNLIPGTWSFGYQTDTRKVPDTQDTVFLSCAVAVGLEQASDLTATKSISSCPTESGLRIITFEAESPAQINPLSTPKLI